MLLKKWAAKTMQGVQNFLQVAGTLEKNRTAVELPRIEGKWDESLTAFMPDGSQQLIWKTSPPAKDPTRSAQLLLQQDLCLNL